MYIDAGHPLDCQKRHSSTGVELIPVSVHVRAWVRACVCDISMRIHFAEKTSHQSKQTPDQNYQARIFGSTQLLQLELQS